MVSDENKRETTATRSAVVPDISIVPFCGPHPDIVTATEAKRAASLAIGLGRTTEGFYDTDATEAKVD